MRLLRYVLCVLIALSRYQDWLDDITNPNALVLDGGMKAWVERNGADESLTQECALESVVPDT